MHNAKGSQKRRELIGEDLAELKRKNAEYRKRTAAERVEYNRQYRAEHPEWRKKVARNYYHSHKEKRKAEGRIRVREWKRKNPEKVRNHNHLRRARKLGNGGEGYTQEERDLQLRSQKGLCWWCGVPMGEDVTEDHFIPISRGGKHEARNIVLCHLSCNCSKGGRLPHEWIGRLL